MEKLLPNNLEAEKGVLGSIILDPEAITQVADFLQPSDFYRDIHNTIYAAMKKLYEQREPADIITLCDELSRQEKLEQIGGSGYITALVNQVPTSAHIEYYGHIVERCAILRRLIHAAGQIAAVAYEEADAEAAIQKAEQLLFEVTQNRQRNDFVVDTTILGKYLDDLDELHKSAGSIIGVPTGFNQLDFYLGGLQKSDLIILAARPSMGKSSFMLNIGYNAVQDYEASVAIFSLEMSKKQLMQRMISRDTHIDLYRLRNGQVHDDEWQLISDSSARLSTNRLWIDDTGAISLSALCSRARRLHAQQRLDLIIVDYLQLMTVASSGSKGANRVQVIGEITHGLKALAKELDIPILALAQLSREVEKRAVKVPQLSDLRESGDIENDADVVLFIYREDSYDPDSLRKGQADIIIAKHRNGPTGDVCLRFDPAFTEFSNREEKK